MQFVRLPPLPTCRPDAASAAQVTILLGLCNGGSFIRAQLDSLTAQTHRNWRILVGDDGSTDDGPSRLQDWSRCNPAHPLHFAPGPGRGFAQNFLSLLCAAGAERQHIAFCDQDDVWLPDKLERGVSALSAVPEDRPALYCSRVLVTNSELGILRPSATWRHPPGFAHALVQNIASGNSYLLNPAAVRLAQAAQRRIGPVSAHDWWIYQLVSGAGGTILCDPQPTLLYRQHAANVIGANHGRRALFRRAGLLLRGEVRTWIDQHITALEQVMPYLTAENRALLTAFATARTAHPLRRSALLKLGLHHQTRGSTFVLHAALVAGLA